MKKAKLPTRNVLAVFEFAGAAALTLTKAGTQRHGGWPAKVTAFCPEMAVHGRYGQPCPDCGSPVQRIRIAYANNEANCCAHCQTGGTLLANRALSKLLHESWPKHIDELG